MNVGTLAALADEAHKHGQRVLTHTVTVERGKLAADACIDVIAHSIQDGVLDADAIARIKQAGTFYAPTLAIYQLKPDELGPGRKGHPATRPRIRKSGFAEDHVRNFHPAGLPLPAGAAAGIDSAKHRLQPPKDLAISVA